jgi:outer membrane protein assembly factor BamB
MVFYFVQRGETLYAIAKRYQTTVHALVTANRLEDPNAIAPGQALIIPRPGEVPSPPPGGIVHLIRSGETIFKLAERFGTPPSEILRANQIAHPEFILPGQQLVIPERMDSGNDWPMLGRTPGRAGASPVVLPGAPRTDWSFLPPGAGSVLPSAPVVRYERVYAGLGDGRYYAFDRMTGRLQWQAPAGGSHSASCRLPEPAVYDGLVYLCEPEGALQAVDAYSGKQVWRAGVPGPPLAAPAVAHGIVFLGTGTGYLQALEAKTGAIVWQRSVEAPANQPVAIGDERLFAVTEAGELWALNAETGEVLWRTRLPAMGAPVFGEVVLLVGPAAFDPHSGQLLWQATGVGGNPAVLLDQVIYTGGVVDLFTGQMVRPYAGDPEAVPQAPPLVAGSTVIHASTEGKLLGRNLYDGQLAWALDLPTAGDQPPTITSGQILLTLADGSLSSYRCAGSGTER